MKMSAPGEGVDHHLPLHRAGDLHVPLLEILRRGGDLPVAAPYGLGGGEEVRHLPAVERFLALRPGG
jgi:hypothetical protein